MSSDLQSFKPMTDEEKEKLMSHIYMASQHKIDFKVNAKKNKAKRRRRKLRGKK